MNIECPILIIRRQMKRINIKARWGNILLTSYKGNANRYRYIFKTTDLNQIAIYNTSVNALVFEDGEFIVVQTGEKCFTVFEKYIGEITSANTLNKAAKKAQLLAYGYKKGIETAKENYNDYNMNIV